MLEIKVFSSLSLDGSKMSSNLTIKSFNFILSGFNLLSKITAIISKAISGVLVLSDGIVKLGVPGITITNKSLKVGNVSVEFGIETLVLLNCIREFLDLAVFFFELLTVSSKVEFLSIKPGDVVFDGSYLLGNGGYVGCNCMVSVSNLGIFGYNYAVQF